MHRVICFHLFPWPLGVWITISNAVNKNTWNIMDCNPHFSQLALTKKGLRVYEIIFMKQKITGKVNFEISTSGEVTDESTRFLLTQHAHFVTGSCRDIYCCYKMSTQKLVLISINPCSIWETLTCVLNNSINV